MTTHHTGAVLLLGSLLAEGVGGGVAPALCGPVYVVWPAATPDLRLFTSTDPGGEGLVGHYHTTAE